MKYQKVRDYLDRRRGQFDKMKKTDGYKRPGSLKKK